MRVVEPTIVVVGSLHYDIMITAPDRPRKGETVSGTAWRPKFGGKGGNQAAAVVAAGARARMAGAVGDDGFGVFLLEGLARAGVDHDHVAVMPGVGSGMSVAISDAEGDYGAVIVSGANLAIDPTALASSALWDGARALILQNEVPEEVNIAAATAARSAGVLVCLNAAPARPLSRHLSGLVDVLVVNALEAEMLVGIAVNDLASATMAAERLGRHYPSALVTVGGMGLAGVTSGASTIALPALSVTLVSSHGAGDVFVGTFVAALVIDVPFAEALAIANEAAAKHVSRTAEG